MSIINEGAQIGFSTDGTLRGDTPWGLVRSQDGPEYLQEELDATTYDSVLGATASPGPVDNQGRVMREYKGGISEWGPITIEADFDHTATFTRGEQYLHVRWPIGDPDNTSQAEWVWKGFIQSYGIAPNALGEFQTVSIVFRPSGDLHAAHPEGSAEPTAQAKKAKA